MIEIAIGTRKSKLAMWQTNTVAGMLEAEGMSTRISSMETIGDKVLDTSIAKIGSKGVFTEELEAQLASGETDIAVHSAKDMQSRLPEGFELIAFTDREKVNDVLVSDDPTINIGDSSRKLRIGTSSVRRVALLNHFYPHVETVEMRGNLQTRIRKMREGDCDALMLAYAGVKRMEYEDLIVKIFSEEEFIPPVGQGCIGIEAATTLDPEKRKKIRKCLNNAESEACLLAERAYLKQLEGGCSIPAFGLAKLDGDTLTLKVGLASLDGSKILQKVVTGTVAEAETMGKEAGDYILDNGGREMLAEIRRQQK
ncbi:hydroxymethylbilane synthase [Desulfopila aestuarii]|uniref:Hydroxymethylbilane synthase n=1 Tax=Desulfopila aestuarii DSM 18488 TaxID=1121416 RepID=A0A1M7Y6D8_9BACT|nr:hydroxymethylbilane synthase [Desulfopila aestuarii]SHO48202.1 hydroxymethylbilane synthase [Desulfopila aestuarii DSM 18488]